MADAHRRSVEADRRDHLLARSEVGTHQRFPELGAVAGQSAGDRDPIADRAGDSGNERAAVDVQAIRQNKNSSKIGRRQSPAYRVAARMRMLRRRRRLAGETKPGRVEADGGGSDLVVGDVVVANLTASAATQYVRIREHRAQFVIARATGQR